MVTPPRRRLIRGAAIGAAAGLVVLAGYGIGAAINGSGGGSNKSAATTSTSPTTTSPGGGSSATTAPAQAPGAFTYGYDFSNQEPDSPSGAVTANAAQDASSPAATAAESVMRSLGPVYVDQAIYGFGVGNPEPSPGVYNMSGIAARISLITSAGDTPVITLVSAPPWMKAGTGFDTPPAPAHYQDFAALCAHVAQSFPQVKYFAVWSEVRGYFNKQTHAWDYQDYTTLYNDVYTAIKAVRPDAMVGGPYATMSTFPHALFGKKGTLPGANGYFDNGMLDTVSYWLAHKVGADFIAVDGATEVAKSNDASLESPADAARQYAAVDEWIRSQTDLPIWWMESHIQPSQGWTVDQAAAARVATLMEMASSGARVGMQWQPQEQSGWADEGLWTSTLDNGGGQATPLDAALISALPVLDKGPRLVSGQPDGVLVATDAAGTLAVNTTSQPATATDGSQTWALQPGQVKVVS